MPSSFRRLSLHFFLTMLTLLAGSFPSFAADPLPLKRIVELALTHSTTAAESDASVQRAYALYRETRNAYVPTLNVGSGLGATYGYPLTLEGSAPSIVNTTAQSSVLNAALRDFVRQARIEWQASTVQTKDQRDEVIQDAALSYIELNKWETLQAHLSEDYAASLKMEQFVNERIQQGVDSPQARTQARLSTARVYLHISQAQGSIDVLRAHLSQLTGLPAAGIVTTADSIPALPDIKQDDNLAARAVETSPAIEIASLHANALHFGARAEHRSMWPTFDFAAQYALLATFNNYQRFFRANTFQPNNASVGAVIRFPFFNRTQRARADAADADALLATKRVEATKHQVGEHALQLQRSVDQLAAAREVASLEYDVAKSDLSAVDVRLDSGTATIHDEDQARTQAAERYDSLQDANFQLERAQVLLLRMTGDLAGWAGVPSK
jgi:outer membrane protein TolC